MGLTNKFNPIGITKKELYRDLKTVKPEINTMYKEREKIKHTFPVESEYIFKLHPVTAYNYKKILTENHLAKEVMPD